MQTAWLIEGSHRGPCVKFHLQSAYDIKHDRLYSKLRFFPFSSKLRYYAHLGCLKQCLERIAIHGHWRGVKW